MVSKHENHHH
jgi:hypothetical protein